MAVRTLEMFTIFYDIMYVFKMLIKELTKHFWHFMMNTNDWLNTNEDLEYIFVSIRSLELNEFWKKKLDSHICARSLALFTCGTQVL